MLPSRASAAAQTIAPGNTGQISIEYLPLLTSLSYGQNRTVARLLVTGDPSKDMALDGMTFTDGGSAADADLQHFSFVLQNGGRVSDITAQMAGRTVSMRLTQPLLIRANERGRIDLRADVLAGRRRTVQFVIEESADVQVHTCTGTQACPQAH